LPALVAVCGYELKDGIDQRAWAVVTENRTDLWTVAWAKFTERPLTGYGADSWADDLIPRTPGLYSITKVLVQTHSGGYHNAYFTLLAEEGIFIFAFALYVLASALGLIGQFSGSNRQERTKRVMFLFTFLFLILRGFIEVPGLFGYGQDPAEFASYALLALMISSARGTRAAHRSARRDHAQALALAPMRFAQ
jgi:O-antigen ligase